MEFESQIPVAVYEPPRGWFPGVRWRELWEYRELLYFLTWRDIKIRYKQAALGVTWAVLWGAQPGRQQPGGEQEFAGKVHYPPLIVLLGAVLSMVDVVWALGLMLTAAWPKWVSLMRKR